MRERRKRQGGREYLYGRQPVLEALRAGRRRVFRVLLAAGSDSPRGPDEAVRAAEGARCPVERVDRRALQRTLGAVNHQGIAAEVGAYPYVEFMECLSGMGERVGPALVLLLDHLQDPQNLGALLRVAEATGVDAVLLPVDRAASVTPAAVRASAGAAEHMTVSRVTNLARAMEALKREGLWLAGLDPGAGAARYTDADLTTPLGLVVGGEGRGLGRLVRERCDFLIHLPQHGRVGSLNAATAGAVALYEVLRQRSAAHQPGQSSG
jgi:23S rRNA (guanosine2251-2'-O)-methyltransferase